jgi:hypothetical protein
MNHLLARGNSSGTPPFEPSPTSMTSRRTGTQHRDGTGELRWPPRQEFEAPNQQPTYPRTFDQHRDKTEFRR